MFMGAVIPRGLEVWKFRPIRLICNGSFDRSVHFLRMKIMINILKTVDNGFLLNRDSFS
jgi:hypothetical protein